MFANTFWNWAVPIFWSAFSYTHHAQPIKPQPTPTPIVTVAPTPSPTPSPSPTP